MKAQTSLALRVIPPKLPVQSVMSQWVALVLAVSDYAEVSTNDLLFHTSRSGRILAEARRLLVWGFREVCDTEEPETVAWLTMAMSLNKRAIITILTEGSPQGLREVVETYTRLVPLIGYDELREAVGAGIFGQRGERSRLWSKGFTESLGLRPM